MKNNKDKHTGFNPILPRSDQVEDAIQDILDPTQGEENNIALRGESRYPTAVERLESEYTGTIHRR